MQAAIDFGITNIDVIYRRAGELAHLQYPNNGEPVTDQLTAVAAALDAPGDPLVEAAVTGGQYRRLPDQAGGIRLVKIPEVMSIGRGGLHLSGLEEALVVSAGSGTAMVAARGKQFAHATGSAVGGGTLQGLGRLLLGTADALEIDRLAMSGDPNHADLTLVEAVGSAVGKLPLRANAVNFGRLSREAVDLSPEDTAAALVRMVAQVIAMVAINAVRAEGLSQIVIIGHLVDLPSIRAALDEVFGFYDASFCVPDQPGIGTAIGALLCLEDE